MMLARAERAELQRQGAKAAARGEAVCGNPMRRSLNQPTATGESLRLWAQRERAWREGFDAQRALGRRAGRVASPGPVANAAKARAVAA